MNKECEHYFNSFCLKDITSARVWDCTANKEKRLKILKKYKFDSIDMDLYCPYPKLRKK